MKKLLAHIKRRWDAYLERMVKANQEHYGSERLDCCGQGLSMTTGRTALTISGGKLKAIKDQLFDGVVTVCPFCTKMLDSKQRAIRVSTDNKEVNMPVLYYTQLLGLAMGLDAKQIGLNLNSSPVGEILNKIGGNKK